MTQEEQATGMCCSILIVGGIVIAALIVLGIFL